jgi:hypothetical protein
VRKAPEAYGLTKTKVASWKTPGEPAFVSMLLDVLMSDGLLAWAIHDWLTPAGLSDGEPLVSGVFMHQKPKVKFSRCHVELADLLFVRHHFVVGRGAVDVQARAFLLQAKASSTPSTGALSGKEAEQFKLYSNWKTPLSFPNGELGLPADGSSKWNLGLGPMPHPQHSGLYGLVFNGTPWATHGFPDDCPWATGRALRGMSQVVGSRSLGEHLASFLIGSAGRPWDINPQAHDHWSQFVHRCLEKAAGWSYPVQRLGVSKQPRLRQALAFVSAFDSIKQASEIDAGRAESQAAFTRRQEWRRQFPDDFVSPPEVPPGSEAEPPPSGGVSVLYTATFGPRPLNEVSPLDNEQLR